MATAGATSTTYLSPGRVLNPWLRGDYLQFTPSCPAAKQDALKVHRVVALAFLGPCPPGMEVNHRDGVKTNNRLDNLEYVTRGENIRHAMKMGLNPVPAGTRNPRAVLCEGDVLAIRAAWPARSLQRLADEYGVTKGQIAHIVHRRTWTHVK